MPTPDPGVLRRVLARGLLAALSPMLFGLYAGFPFLGFLPYVALVPWILLYTSDRSPRPSAGWYVAGAWVGWMLQHPAVAHFGWFVPPIMAAVLFVGWLPFPFLIATIHRRFRWPRAVTVPIVWVAIEWFRSTVTLAHFDLYALSYSQARVTPLVQLCDLTGAYGVSFLLAAVNGWVADAIATWRSRGSSELASSARRRLALSGGAIVALFVASFGYGFFRLAQAQDEPGPRVALVQPNVAHNDRNAIGVHLSQVIFTDERVPAGAADLIVWPENAILDNIRRPESYLPDLGRLAREKGAYLLVGSMAKARELPGRTINAAFLIDGDGAIRGEARKQILFPWSELVPADAWLKRALPPLWRLQRTLVRTGWGFVPTGVAGDETVVLGLPWNGATVPFGVLICVENAYPPIPAEASRKGARFLVNITSEREVGGPVQEQLLRISMLRAVENRVAYVRCGNSGISAFVDPEGRLRRVLRGEHGGTIFDHGVAIDRVLLGPSEPTPYARSHDAFALLCVIVSLGLFGVGLMGRRPVAGRVALLAASIVMTATSCAGPPRVGGDAAGAQDELRLGRAAMARGDPARAVKPLARACATGPTCREAIPLLSQALLATRRFEEAAELFGAIAVSEADCKADALVAQAGFLDRMGELAAAEAAYEDALRLDPDASAWATLGTLRMRMDKPEEALAAYEAAVTLTPDAVQPRYLHARALWLTGRFADSEREIDAVLTDAPDHGAAWAIKGRLRDAAGDGPGALTAYREALRSDRDNVEARFMLARRALAAKDFGQAERWLQEIMAIDTRTESSRGRAGEPSK